MNCINCFRLLTIVLLMLTAGTALAQKEGLVTLDLKQARMADVLKELEKQAGYRFYYDTTDLDTTRIDLNVQQQPFTRVLDQIFSEKDLSWSIDSYGHVFIVRGEAIHTELPPDFFTRTDTAYIGSSGKDTARTRQEQTSSLQVAAVRNIIASSSN